MRKTSVVRALLELQAQLKPDVLFLSEAHLCKARVENLCRRLCFDHMLVSVSDGRSGGLVLFWNNDIQVTSSEVTPNFIDIYINEHNEGDGGLLVYMGNQVVKTNTLLGSIFVVCMLLLIFLGLCLVISTKFYMERKRRVEMLDPRDACKRSYQL
jgi:hypothetical protein